MILDSVVTFLKKAGVLKGGFATYKGTNVGGEYATLGEFGQHDSAPPAARPAPAPAPEPAVARPPGPPPGPAEPVRPSSPAGALLNVLSWLFGVPVVVMGIGILFTTLAGGLAWILGGLILIPPTNRLLGRLTRVRITGWRKAVALLACTLAFFVAATFVADEPALTDDARYDLAFMLEDELGMRDVLVRQAGSSVEIRFRQPTMPAAELFGALTTVSDVVEPLLPEGIETIRYVFTVNAVDAAYVEVPCAAMRQWREGTFNNVELVKSFRRVPLL